MLRNIPLCLAAMLFLASAPAPAKDKPAQHTKQRGVVIHSLGETVVKMPHAKGVSLIANPGCGSGLEIAPT